MAFQLNKGPRWGDRWAKTKVIWKKYPHKAPFDTRGILCHACGYNLTGNTSGRCPECGQDIPETQIRAPAANPPALVPTASGPGT